ncbi:MAG: isoprenyl transferase, partial [Lentisphaeria bacterium]
CKNTLRHIAIIMDGNGRWAKLRGKPRTEGHRAGAKTVETIIKSCANLGIEYLTLYAFSIENWQRPQSEIKALMLLLSNFLKKHRKLLKNESLRLRVIGRTSMLPESIKIILDEVIAETANNTKGTITLALSYGSRSEIVDATKQIAKLVASGNLDPEMIDEKLFANYLYEPQQPDPDLLIRTSGEIRLSNFLLWQLSYTEFAFTPTLWPDFSAEEFHEIINTYQNRNRNFGGIKNA